MTFTELVTEIMDRLNLSSAEATARVGRALNRKYKLVTSAVGLQLSRRATVQQAVTIGVSTVIFTNAEKVINVYNRTVTPYRLLEEVTIDELRESQPYTTSSSPSKYAIASHTADTISVEFNCIPQTAFVLYADVHAAVSTLSGSQEPAFPESFHDVLIEGVMADELRKMEKAALAGVAKGEYERILSDLRMWIAKNNALDIYQGKTAQNSPRSSVGSSSSGSVNGALSYTQTGLITFDRDPLAPFAVSASSAVVPNLDADKLDGFDESAFAKLADNETISGNWNFDGTVDFDGAIDASGAGSIILPQTAVPAQTAEGSVVWDTNDDLLTIGTGAARKTMVDTNSTQTLSGKTLTAPVISGDVTGTYALKGSASLWNTVTSTATGTQNNWAPGLIANTVLMVTNGSALTITGIAAGYEGQVVRIVSNSSVNAINFTYNAGGSSAANRLILLNQGGVSIISSSGNGYIDFQYDATGGFWRQRAHTQGAWLPYTTVWGNLGTANTLGNGVLTSTYYVTDTICRVRIKFVWGNTTVAGNNTWTFTLPFTNDGVSMAGSGVAQCFDNSAGSIYWAGLIDISTTGVAVGTNASPTVGFGTTQPFVWATSDQLALNFSYGIV